MNVIGLISGTDFLGVVVFVIELIGSLFLALFESTFSSSFNLFSYRFGIFLDFLGDELKSYSINDLGSSFTIWF